MSKQQAQQFLTAIQNDESMENKLQESLNLDQFEEIESKEHIQNLFQQIGEFASKQGFEFTSKEFAKVAKETDSDQDEELTDQELENVAGGGLVTGLGKLVGAGAEELIDTEIYDCDNFNIFD